MRKSLLHPPTVVADDVGRSDSERSAALVAWLAFVAEQPRRLLVSSLVPRLALVSLLSRRDRGEGRRDGREGNCRCEDEREYSPHDASPPFGRCCNGLRTSRVTEGAINKCTNLNTVVKLFCQLFCDYRII